MIETICKKVAAKIKEGAIASVDKKCIYWHHQPQIPDMLNKLCEEKKFETKR